MNAVWFGLAIVASYLLGSIPAGYLVGRMKGVDLRQHGSGNVGATNVVRLIGKPWGIGVFVFDFLKGFVPAFFLAPWVATRHGIGWSTDAVALTLGLAAMVGHVFPIWLGLRGGKGVATSAGFFAGICPAAIAITLAIWYVLLRATRYVSVASMVASACLPVVFVLWVGTDAAFGERRVVTILAATLAALIVYLHRANIGRLLKGEELRVGSARTGGERAS